MYTVLSVMYGSEAFAAEPFCRFSKTHFVFDAFEGFLCLFLEVAAAIALVDQQIGGKEAESDSGKRADHVAHGAMSGDHFFHAKHHRCPFLSIVLNL